ncbi:MAG: hypothetical protein FOGNACKC_04102 [Anaerolineae bacterium]|mgnify:CR=1 FL=1|nr:hypothetical protein [Anaerolineae bacterium]
MSTLSDRLQEEISVRERVGGLSPIDLLDMPEILANIISQMVRRNGMHIDEVARQLGQSVADAQLTMDNLVAKGYVRRVEVNHQVWYKAYFSRKADKNAGIWSLLGEVLNEIS